MKYTFELEAQEMRAINIDKYEVTLTEEQYSKAMRDLLMVGSEVIEPIHVDLQAARLYFYSKEGYMGTDEECIKLWRANYE